MLVRLLRQRPRLAAGLGSGVGAGRLPRHQPVNKSWSAATTPPQITPGLDVRVGHHGTQRNPATSRWPHMPIRAGSASGKRFIEATAFNTSTT